MLDQLEHLKKSFEPCLPRGRAYDIVAYMVDATLKQLTMGSSAPITFNKDNFVAACHESHDPGQVDASKWVPKSQALNGALQRLQVNLGTSERVVLHEQVGGGRGNTNQYWLALEEKIPSKRPGNNRRSIWISITGRPPRVKSNRFLAALDIPRGRTAQSQPQRDIFLSTLFLLSVAWILLFAVGVLDAYLSNEPLTLGNLTRLAVCVLSYYFVWRLVYHPWWQLIDHRVVLAPNGTAAITEDPCQLEMYRHGTEKWIRLVRFTADCPLCGAVSNWPEASQTSVNPWWGAARKALTPMFSASTVPSRSVHTSARLYLWR
ncbi:hypothetical protein ACE0DR_25340 [Azotobacter sp. CWF10]